MMTIKPGVLLAVLFKFLCSTAQPQIKISGRITDSNDKPLSFVSVVLLRDSSFAGGAVADETGNFHLSFDFEQGKNYSLKLSLTGYKVFMRNFVYPDTIFFSHIILNREQNVLGNVTVTTKKPLLIRKADRYIINVENSFLANGNSGL